MELDAFLKFLNLKYDCGQPFASHEQINPTLLFSTNQLNIIIASLFMLIHFVPSCSSHSKIFTRKKKILIALAISFLIFTNMELAYGQIVNFLSFLLGNKGVHALNGNVSTYAEVTSLDIVTYGTALPEINREHWKIATSLLEVQLKPSDFQITPPTPAFGNCFFCAIIDQLMLVPRYQLPQHILQLNSSHKKLREAVVEFAINSALPEVEHIRSNMDSGIYRTVGIENFKTYMDNMVKPYVYADEYIINFTALYLNMTINIISSLSTAKSKIIKIQGHDINNSTPNLFIIHFVDAEHYQSIRKISSQQPVPSTSTSILEDNTFQELGSQQSDIQDSSQTESSESQNSKFVKDLPKDNFTSDKLRNYFKQQQSFTKNNCIVSEEKTEKEKIKKSAGQRKTCPKKFALTDEEKKEHKNMLEKAAALKRKTCPTKKTATDEEKRERRNMNKRARYQKNPSTFLEASQKEYEKNPEKKIEASKKTSKKEYEKNPEKKKQTSRLYRNKTYSRIKNIYSSLKKKYCDNGGITKRMKRNKQISKQRERCLLTIKIEHLADLLRRKQIEIFPTSEPKNKSKKSYGSYFSDARFILLHLKSAQTMFNKTVSATIFSLKEKTSKSLDAEQQKEDIYTKFQTLTGRSKHNTTSEPFFSYRNVTKYGVHGEILIARADHIIKADATTKTYFIKKKKIKKMMLTPLNP